MCGLAGIFGELGSSPQDQLLRMGAAIKHRGPDSHGVWLDATAEIGFVHQRLSIVDLSEAGHQPMWSASKRYVIAFNGEVYNHLDLRLELEKSGNAPNWRGTSDTETLLACVEQYGLNTAIKSWVGMFAFALWDTQENTLTLGRDRFGEKPLYYGRSESEKSGGTNRLLFASELRAIVASDHFQLEIDKAALLLYFRHHYVPAPYSILKGFNKLPAGCFATFKACDAAPDITRYWFAPDVAKQQATVQFDGSLTDATDRVEALLKQSIAGQSVADVPVGAFLSGGIDSSTVVALMQQVMTSPVKTFTVGFAESTINEAEHAKAVAEHLRTDHTEFYLTGTDARDLIPDIAHLSDEPFADPSQLPTYVVSRLAKEQVTVSLSGDGGDELFGGYTRYAQAARAISMRRKLGGAGGTVARAVAKSPLFKYTPTGQLQPAYIPGVLKRHAQSVSRAVQILAQPKDSAAYLDMVSYWKPPCSAAANDAKPAIPMLDASAWLTEGTAQEAVQMLDLMNYLPDDILTKVDRCGMQMSLESRIPMLDHRLAEFVWSLPTEFRANAESPKQILFDIACRHVPRHLIERPKSGFGIPIAQWLRGPLKDWAEGLLDVSTMTEQGLIDADRVRLVWSEFLAGNDYMGDLIWSVLIFQAWYEQLLSDTTNN